MDIMQVVKPLVCTCRHEGLLQSSLRVLRDSSGKFQVAVDSCSSRPGNWVYVVSGSAARYATGEFATLTDLTVGGIIDFWEEESGQTEQAV
ncbi:carboxysome peptide B [Gammaproteobacteria bacterium AH-315-C21]|nr:carboxysome peptide B [Gammaproteobacteria bacterium]MBN4078924.1 carboxysome peptide B [Gammaproteobacteria bacterium AH-315-C21]PCH62089.1 MAG: carboxysome peptide B [Gammaproteobacteria bacterium]